MKVFGASAASAKSVGATRPPDPSSFIVIDRKANCGWKTEDREEGRGHEEGNGLICIKSIDGWSHQDSVSPYPPILPLHSQLSSTNFRRNGREPVSCNELLPPLKQQFLQRDNLMKSCQKMLHHLCICNHGLDCTLPPLLRAVEWRM